MTQAAKFNKAPSVNQQNKQEDVTLKQFAKEFSKAIKEDFDEFKENIPQTEEAKYRRKRAAAIAGSLAIAGAGAFNFLNSTNTENSEPAVNEVSQSVATNENQSENESIALTFNEGSNIRSEIGNGRLQEQTILMNSDKELTLDVDPANVNIVESAYDGHFLEIKLTDENRQSIIESSQKPDKLTESILESDEDGVIYISADNRK